MGTLYPVSLNFHFWPLPALSHQQHCRNSHGKRSPSVMLPTVTALGAGSVGLHNSSGLDTNQQIHNKVCLVEQFSVFPPVWFWAYFRNTGTKMRTQTITEVFVQKKRLWERMAGQDADVLASNYSRKRKQNWLLFRRRNVCYVCETRAFQSLLLSVQQLLRLEEALWTVNSLIYVNRVLPRFENNILAENSLLRV